MFIGYNAMFSCMFIMWSDWIFFFFSNGSIFALHFIKCTKKLTANGIKKKQFREKETSFFKGVHI